MGILWVTFDLPDFKKSVSSKFPLNYFLKERGLEEQADSLLTFTYIHEPDEAN